MLRILSIKWITFVNFNTIHVDLGGSVHGDGQGAGSHLAGINYKRGPLPNSHPVEAVPKDPDRAAGSSTVRAYLYLEGTARHMHAIWIENSLDSIRATMFNCSIICTE